MKKYTFGEELILSKDVELLLRENTINLNKGDTVLYCGLTDHEDVAAVYNEHFDFVVYVNINDLSKQETEQ